METSGDSDAVLRRNFDRGTELSRCMFETERQKRDLKYAAWFAAIVMVASGRFYWQTAELLGIWIGIGIGVLSFFIAYVFLRVLRMLLRVSGLDKPLREKKQEVEDQIAEVVAEVEEEIEQEREDAS